MPVERTLAEEGRMVGLQFNWIVLDQRWKYSSISLFWKYWNLSLETGDKLYSDTPPPRRGVFYRQSYIDLTVVCDFNSHNYPL